MQYRKDISYESNHVNHLCDFEKVWENFFKKNFIREETSTAISTTTSVHFVEFDYPSCRRFSKVNPYRRSYISYRETSIPVSNDHLPSTLLKLSGVRDKITYRRIRSLKTGSKLDNVDPLSPNVVYFLCSG